MEKNKLKRAWIWFWYNTTTRFLVILIPTYFVLLIPALIALGVPGEHMRHWLTFIYLAGFGWAVVDNDYENLYRIGLDTERRPMSPKAKADFLLKQGHRSA